jgi:hypothetical protein
MQHQTPGMSVNPFCCMLYPFLQVASSPADVARQSDITFAMLSDPPAAVQVATGPGGILEGEQQQQQQHNSCQM